MAKVLKHLPDESEEGSAEERKRRAERLGAFYQKRGEEPPAEEKVAAKPRIPSLTEVNPVLRSEFNTLSYLAIGLSLIALLAIGIFFFRPPKPEAELQALAEAQTQTRATLEQLAGQVTTLNHRADGARQSELARSLRVTSVALAALRAQGSPEIRAEAEALQARIEELLGELDRGAKAGTPP